MYFSVAEPRRHVNYLQLISATYMYVSVDPPLVPPKFRITLLTRNGDLLGFIALVCGAEDEAVSDVIKDGGAGVIHFSVPEGKNRHYYVTIQLP